ncbi:MAG: YdhR family protein [Candidatus Zixiibacteriota bacterium]|nr:MAG: YdhR family protein [candidate division Zixibacteria bacterium]
MKETQVPPVLLGKALWLWLSGKVRFPKDLIGHIIKEEEDFKIFRKVIVLDKDLTYKTPGAIFKIKFQFAKSSFDTNRRLSRIPIPFIIAQPGFISKTWLVGLETGAFQGLYEWETRETANNYINSFPLKLMKKRAKSDSISIHIESIG